MTPHPNSKPWFMLFWHDSSLLRGVRRGMVSIWMVVAMLSVFSFQAAAQIPQRKPVNQSRENTEAKQQIAPKPIYWKQYVFSIPYQVHSNDNAKDAPVEVQLLVSIDRGKTWKKVSAVPPTVRGFNYYAPKDGDYLFALKTIDRVGNAWPATRQPSLLNVVVDTHPPTLKLASKIQPSGELLIDWVATDKNLAPQSLTIEAQIEGETTWRPVRELKAPARAIPNGLQGSFVLNRPHGNQAIRLRASIEDKAGNRFATRTQIAGTQSSRGVMAHTAAAGSHRVARENSGHESNLSGPILLGPNETHSANFKGDSRNQTPERTLVPSSSELDFPSDDNEAAQTWAADETIDENGETLRAPAPSARNTIDPRNHAIGPAGPQGQQSGSLSQLNRTPIANPQPTRPTVPLWNGAQYEKPHSAARNDVANDKTANIEAARTKTTQPAWQTLPSVGRQQFATQPSNGLVGAQGFSQPKLAPVRDGNSPARRAIPAQPQFGTPSLLNRNITANRRSNTSSLLPAGVQPNEIRMINSKAFTLEYSIESVGPRGIGRVELWGTTDGGKHWKRFGEDPDRISPMALTVPTEGVYGFKILVHSAGSYGEAPPRSGDRPDVWVRVDLQPPTVHLIDVKKGQGIQADQLTLRWNATDDNLAANPIAIQYAGHPAGPWTNVTTQLHNTGYYTWRLVQHLPEKLYIRIQARDQAGNVGSYSMADPLIITRPRPMGRIQGVRVQP